MTLEQKIAALRDPIYGIEKQAKIGIWDFVKQPGRVSRDVIFNTNLGRRALGIARTPISFRSLLHPIDTFRTAAKNRVGPKVVRRVETHTPATMGAPGSFPGMGPRSRVVLQKADDGTFAARSRTGGKLTGKKNPREMKSNPNDPLHRSGLSGSSNSPNVIPGQSSNIVRHNPVRPKFTANPLSWYSNLKHGLGRIKDKMGLRILPDEFRIGTKSKGDGGIFSGPNTYKPTNISFFNTLFPEGRTGFVGNFLRRLAKPGFMSGPQFGLPALGKKLGTTFWNPVTGMVLGTAGVMQGRAINEANKAVNVANNLFLQDKQNEIIDATDQHNADVDAAKADLDARALAMAKNTFNEITDDWKKSINSGLDAIPREGLRGGLYGSILGSGLGVGGQYLLHKNRVSNYAKRNGISEEDAEDELGTPNYLLGGMGGLALGGLGGYQYGSSNAKSDFIDSSLSIT